MRINPVKKALSRGKLVAGTMAFEFAVPALVHIADAVGADFVMFDMEHSGLSLERLSNLSAVAAGTDIVTFVRVPSSSYQFMSRPLDVGVKGLMIPNVESVEQAQRIVEETRYPPEGRRGVGLGLAADVFRESDPRDTMDSANENLLLIAQIESAKGLDNAEGIAAVDGIDVLWIGHYDLTTSLGIPGRFDDPTYLRALDQVIEACDKHDKAGGFCPGSIEEATDLIQRGFRCIAFSNDVAIYRSGLRNGLDAVRHV